MYSWKQLHRLYSLTSGPVATWELAPRWNVAPSQEAPVVIGTPAGGREVVMASWGLIARWADAGGDRPRPINAK